ncbi:MAG: hypothetical protein IJI43_03460 [Bacilli bacterium]|nr:hypothetical protein [Bacilli bacterium]
MIKRIFGVIWDILEILIIIYVIFITACILFRNDYGFTQFGDYTLASLGKNDAKYIKNTNNGDLLIVKKSKNIAVGDYIYYYAVIDESYVIRTGVVQGVTKDDYNSLYNIKTKISNDKTVKISVNHKRVLGKAANNYAKLGDILKFLETRLGFLVFVLLPIMLVFVYQIYIFVVLLNYEKKETLNKIISTNNKEALNKPEVKEEKPVEKEVPKEEEKKDDEDIEVL